MKKTTCKNLRGVEDMMKLSQAEQHQWYEDFKKRSTPYRMRK